jgi:GAF domain-containing protein
MTEPSVPQPPTDELLHSVVAVARAIFGAAAAAVFLLDREADTLTFTAVSGVGEDNLVGSTFPARFGVVGWVVASGEPIEVDDLATNRPCADEIAHITGYRPQALMVAPLVSGGEVLGLIVVLDPVAQSRSNLTDLELLAMFADQAAVALRVLDLLPAPRTDHDTRTQLLDEFRQFLDRTAT